MPLCGEYRITEQGRNWLQRNLDDSVERRAVLTHAIRRMVDANRGGLVDLTREWVKTIVQTGSLPQPNEQIDNLIAWIAEHTAAGQYVTIGPNHRAIMGAVDASVVGWALDYLEEERFIQVQIARQPNVTSASLRLSPKGWERHREIRRGALDGRKAFMAMQYGDAELNGVYGKCFKPAVAATGFTLTRLDEEPKAGMIDDRLRVELRTSRFLLADLTHENRGAYWEAGFAEGSGKPVIYTCRKGHIREVHFDTNHHLIVEWDPADLERTSTTLKSSIRATFPDAQLG